MAGRIRKLFINTKSLVYAIVIHLAVLALLLFSFDWGTTTINSSMAKQQVEPIKAKMISEAEVDEQLNRIKAREEEKKRKEIEAKKHLEDLLKQQQLEKQRLADLEKKKQLEAQKAKALAEKRKKEEIRLAKLKREEERKKRAAEEKRKAEDKRKAEERRRAEEQRRQELAEKKKKEELARREAERQAQLQAQLEAEAEERRIAAAVNDALQRYIPIIQKKVDSNWTRPFGLRGLNAGVRVRLTPGGEVISAKVVRSSGNPVFDRSVENAILKASPLPIPSDRRINERFRDIQFNFDPDRNLVS